MADDIAWFEIYVPSLDIVMAQPFSVFSPVYPKLEANLSYRRLTKTEADEMNTRLIENGYGRYVDEQLTIMFGFISVHQRGRA